VFGGWSVEVREKVKPEDQRRMDIKHSEISGVGEKRKIDRRRRRRMINVIPTAT